MIRPRFSPEVNLGHILQAGVLVCALGGGILGAYLTLRSDLDQQRAEFSVTLAGHEARLSIAERALDERHQEDREFAAEMRATLERISQSIADIKTEIVQKQDRK